MFEVDGFKSLYEIRRKFRFENLYFNDQNYIMSRFHPGELSELDMTWDVYDKYEHAAVSYCDGSFGKFLHTVQSFFLMDSDGNAKPVTRAIFSAPIEGNRNYLYI